MRLASPRLLYRQNRGVRLLARHHNFGPGRRRGLPANSAIPSILPTARFQSSLQTLYQLSARLRIPHNFVQVTFRPAVGGSFHSMPCAFSSMLARALFSPYRISAPSFAPALAGIPTRSSVIFLVWLVRVTLRNVDRIAILCTSICLHDSSLA